MTKYAPGTYVSATASNNYGGLLAENVLGIWVQALDPQGFPITQRDPVTLNPNLAGEAFDSRLPYSYTNYLYGSPQVTTNVASAMPASMQVAIAVMDSRTAARLATTASRPTRH